MYYDFAKAFDKVPRARLINKLKSVGISGHLLKWISNWLTGRKQRTVINGAKSSWSEVLSGVPQGSVLGPLLFVIFINDIDMCATILTLLLKFADDTKSGNEIRSQSDSLEIQQCIDNMVEWANNWGMKFNEKKCKVMHFGRSNPNHTYHMNGVMLEKVTNEKDIGVTVSDNLKPSEHCKIIAQTARGVLGQLLRSFLSRDKVIFKNLYTTYVRPHLEFTSQAWNPWHSKDIELLEDIQRKFVRNVTGLTGTTYEEKLVELGLLSLKDRRTYLDLVETYKIVYSISCRDPTIYFEFTGRQRSRITRFTEYPRNIVVKRCNLDTRRNFFTQRVAEPWNRLPIEIKDAPRVELFKKRLKNYMMATHPINEGTEDIEH